MIVLAAVWSVNLLHRNAFGPPWLHWLIVVLAVVRAVGVLWHRPPVGRAVRRDAWPRSPAPQRSPSPPPPRRTTARYRSAARTSRVTGAGWATKPPMPNWQACWPPRTPWSAATNGSQSAAALEIASGTSVMAIGGWSGDPVPTLQQFIDDVHAGKISYYVEAGRGPNSRGSARRGHPKHAAQRVAHPRDRRLGRRALPRHRHRRIDGLPPALTAYHANVSSSQDSDAAAVDPPIPVPDVPGADASARGLPRRVDLTLRQRLIVDSSAVADLGLRTAIASLVGAAMLPPVLSPRCDGPSRSAEHDHCSSTPNWPPRRIRAVVPGADGGAADLVAARQSGRGVDRQRQRAQHPVQQQLRGRQPGDARPVRRLCPQQRRARPALAPRRRAAPHAVRDPRVHGIGVPVQRLVLLAAVVLPVRLRRAAVHVAVPRRLAPKRILPSVVTASSPTALRVSPRRWRRPCTTSGR